MIANLFAAEAIELRHEVSSFSEAVAVSASLLVAAGHAQPTYVDEVLANLRKLGPYFVVAPGIAIVHAAPSQSVLSPGLSLLKLERPVVSGAEENDPVTLVFSLCTPTPDQHIELLSEFARVMTGEGVVNSLLNASAESVIREIFET